MGLYLVADFLLYAVYTLAALGGLVVLVIGYCLGRRRSGHGWKPPAIVAAAALGAAWVVSTGGQHLPRGSSRLAVLAIALAVLVVAVFDIGVALGRWRGKGVLHGGAS